MKHTALLLATLMSLVINQQALCKTQSGQLIASSQAVASQTVIVGKAEVEAARRAVAAATLGCHVMLPVSYVEPGAQSAQPETPKVETTAAPKSDDMAFVLEHGDEFPKR